MDCIVYMGRKTIQMRNRIDVPSSVTIIRSRTIGLLFKTPVRPIRIVFRVLRRKPSSGNPLFLSYVGIVIRRRLPTDYRLPPYIGNPIVRYRWRNRRVSTASNAQFSRSARVICSELVSSARRRASAPRNHDNFGILSYYCYTHLGWKQADDSDTGRQANRDGHGGYS